MTRRNPMKLAALAVTAAVAALPGCAGEERRPYPNYPEMPGAPSASQNRRASDRPSVSGAEGEAGPRPATADEARFRDFGFVLYWDSFLRDEQITSLHLEGDFDRGIGRPQLYAITASNRLYQVDLNSGMVNWLYDVGTPISFAGGSPLSEWVYEADRDSGLKRYDELYFVARDQLVALDKDNGAELWTQRLPFVASSPPRATSFHVAVGSWDDRIYGYRKDDPSFPAWSWRTDGDVVGKPGSDTPALFVPSTDGTLYCVDATDGKVQWPFRTEKPLEHAPLVHKKLLYVPGSDYNLYVVNVLDGLLEWRYGAGAKITGTPAAVDNLVFFTAEGQGLHCVERRFRPRPAEGNPRKTEHELLWRRETATKLVCRGAQHVYVLEPGATRDVQRLVKLDAKTGAERGALELAGVDFVLTNANAPQSGIRGESLLGGIAVLGFKSGWVVALKEIATLPGGVLPED